MTFDSADLEPGVYSRELLISSNNPDESKINLPVTMTVIVVP